MNRDNHRNAGLVVLLSGTTFFYFLIFAQFGYLHLLERISKGDGFIEFVMLTMGIGGAAGSVYAARYFRIEKSGGLLAFGYVVSGLMAVMSTIVKGIWIHAVIASGVGLSLGILTVAVVPTIRVLAPAEQIGRWVSSGVGAAYFLCNIPWVFNSSALNQCLLGAFSACVGLVGILFLPQFKRTELKSDHVGSIYPDYFFKTTGVILLSVLFMMIIWLDSAAFYLIQDSGSLRMMSWGSTGQLWTNATVHLIAAVFCGWIIDRGWLVSSLVISLALLVTGYLLMRTGLGFQRMGGPVYVAGVSIYSTSLVAYGALAAERFGLWSIAARSGMVFALGGWVGSAMGIGMARDLSTVPASFILVVLSVTMGCVCLVFKFGTSQGKVIA